MSLVTLAEEIFAPSFSDDNQSGYTVLLTNVNALSILYSAILWNSRNDRLSPLQWLAPILEEFDLPTKVILTHVIQPVRF